MLFLVFPKRLECNQFLVAAATQPDWKPRTDGTRRIVAWERCRISHLAPVSQLADTWMVGLQQEQITSHSHPNQCEQLLREMHLGEQQEETEEEEKEEAAVEDGEKEDPTTEEGTVGDNDTGGNTRNDRLESSSSPFSRVYYMMVTSVERSQIHTGLAYNLLLVQFFQQVKERYGSKTFDKFHFVLVGTCGGGATAATQYHDGSSFLGPMGQVRSIPAAVAYDRHASVMWWPTAGSSSSSSSSSSSRSPSPSSPSSVAQLPPPSSSYPGVESRDDGDDDKPTRRTRSPGGTGTLRTSPAKKKQRTGTQPHSSSSNNSPKNNNNNNTDSQQEDAEDSGDTENQNDHPNEPDEDHDRGGPLVKVTGGMITNGGPGMYLFDFRIDHPHTVPMALAKPRSPLGPYNDLALLSRDYYACVPAVAVCSNVLLQCNGMDFCRHVGLDEAVDTKLGDDDPHHLLNMTTELRDLGRYLKHQQAQHANAAEGLEQAEHAIEMVADMETFDFFQVAPFAGATSYSAFRVLADIALDLPPAVHVQEKEEEEKKDSDNKAPPTPSPPPANDNAAILTPDPPPPEQEKNPPEEPPSPRTTHVLQDRINQGLMQLGLGSTTNPPITNLTDQMFYSSRRVAKAVRRMGRKVVNFDALVGTIAHTAAVHQQQHSAMPLFDPYLESQKQAMLSRQPSASRDFINFVADYNPLLLNSYCSNLTTASTQNESNQEYTGETLTDTILSMVRHEVSEVLHELQNVLPRH